MRFCPARPSVPGVQRQNTTRYAIATPGTSAREGTPKCAGASHPAAARAPATWIIVGDALSSVGVGDYPDTPRRCAEPGQDCPDPPPVHRASPRVFLVLPIGQQLAQLVELAAISRRSCGEEALDRVAEARVADPVRAVGRHRLVAALQLVRPLRAGLDPGEAVGDREVDRLVVAGLEMEELELAARQPQTRP